MLKYDIETLRSEYLKNTSHVDTIITLTLASGSTIRGVENNLFIFKKHNEYTQIDRISNFRKFNSYNLNDSKIDWDNITVNIQLYINDTIKEYKEITENYKTIFIGQGSDGNTQDLRIYFGKVKHRVFLAPLVDSYNENNINLNLINELTSLVNSITWSPTEKIQSKRMR